MFDFTDREKQAEKQDKTLALLLIGWQEEKFVFFFNEAKVMMLYPEDLKK